MQISDALKKISNLLEDYEQSQSLINNPPAKIPFLDTIGKQDWNATLDTIEYYLEHSVKTYKPNFANRMWSGANAPSVLGELITAITNTSACTTESAPVSTQFEKYLLDEMLNIVGFQNGEGQMTTGSSNANMIAMMVARNKFTNQCKNKGLFNAQKLVAFVNEDAHYSFDKAVNVLGIGVDNLIKVKTNTVGEMDISILEEKIIEQKALGNIPFFVAATLGTTVRGAYDSITQCLKLRDKYNFFLHGDGAWGGAVIMSEKLKEFFLLDVEKLDSFTMDFHKMLNTTLVCNFLLLNNQKGLLTETCSLGDVSYIFREDSDLGVKSLQCGRKVDSLKWFLDWQYYGKQGFAKRVEGYYDLITYAQTLVKKYDELEIISEQYSFNLCFRFIGTNEFNQQIRNKLFADNQALLSLAYIRDKLVFRLLVANINVNKKTLNELFKILITTGEKLCL
ncbi:Glutamate decarboxylase, eukaryotic type [hydrothermal vent metagenome]|uniref:Glutamate decarboxylase, eukaryotic type n=1 Tax=hydrothermal vent metagenome TaxID=652676 RepID=A0A1W1BL04_9ZZZZ